MDIEDVHKNSKLLINGAPYNVEDAEFVKPGKGRAIYKLRMRNLIDGSATEKTYHSAEKVDEASTSQQEEQFLYQQGDDYMFMNTSNFEQHTMPGELVGDKKGYMKEGTLVMVLYMDDRPIDVTIPNFVELKVTETGVAAKAGRVSPEMIFVTLETGVTIQAPPFVKEGDVLKIDTRTGSYVERVGQKK